MVIFQTQSILSLQELKQIEEFGIGYANSFIKRKLVESLSNEIFKFHIEEENKELKLFNYSEKIIENEKTEFNFNFTVISNDDIKGLIDIRKDLIQGKNKISISDRIKILDKILNNVK